jgi:integrase
VPVIPNLATRLTAYRELLGNPASGFMFPSAKAGKPVSMNNLLRREILPALKKAKLQWCGWHAFRRGLATVLYDQAVSDLTIQAILRHSNVTVTRNCYIKRLPRQSEAAMRTLESQLCADRALKPSTAEAPARIQ